MLEFGIVTCDRQRRPVLVQRRAERTLLAMGFCEAFDRREILGRTLQDLLKLPLRILELTEFEKRPAERYAR
jgi:hypothetical protein